MIESKYGLKYSMPHSLVHIVDNSAYTGNNQVINADDPSLFSAIVVSGAPMGEDNKVVTLTRSDIPGVAYGMNNLSVTDIEKYGQSILYVNSLIEQGAPVRFMRITPEGSTYGVSTIVVQYRIDDTDGLFHVRFKEVGIPSELQLDKFANGTRLHSALVKYYNNDDVVDEEGKAWVQRVFITNISAGRGSAYNNMSCCINPTSQPKKPANIKYEFVTIDARTGETVERFFASLVNIDNSNRPDAIEPVNVIVGKRAEGSSIIVPRVNEKAVHEVYNAYMKYFEEQLKGSFDEFSKNAYATMNVNTFDMIYGEYIYNGSDSGYKLPFYQVDMFNSEIPRLREDNRIAVSNIDYDKSSPNVLFNNIMTQTFGVTREGDSVYVGDLYLNSTSSSGLNPTITVVGTINQYTGAITYLNIPKVYPLVANDGSYTVDTSALPVTIATIFNDATSTNGSGSKILNSLVNKGVIETGSVVARISGNTFYLYTVISVDKSVTVGDKYTLSTVYTTKQVYEAIAWNTHSSGSIGVGNIIGRSKNDAAFTRIGACVINTAADADKPIVYVNGYNYTYKESDPFETGRYAVKSPMPCKFGTCPTDIAITNDIVGSEYDVMLYDEEETAPAKWTVDKLTINSGTSTGLNTGEILHTNIGEHVVTMNVTEVDELGALKAVEINSGNVSLISDFACTNAKVLNESNEDTGATVTITTIHTAPTGHLYTVKTATVSSSSKVKAPVGTILTAINESVSFKVTKVDTEGNVSAVDIVDNGPIDGDKGTLASGDTYTITTKLPGGTAGPSLVVSYNEEPATLTGVPTAIYRYMVSGVQGSLFRIVNESNVNIPANYYSETYGINMTSELGGVKIKDGSTGFFDDETMNSIEFKWRYSALLVRAYRGEFDPRIMSATRTPAKYLFDGGTNTIVGQTILPYLKYAPEDIINASTIFTEDEKESVLFDPTVIANIVDFEDIDVKQAMYDLMIHRCYQGIPEDKRPIGPGSGLSLHLDSGVTDATTALLINTSFAKRFTNSNASWDIGGWVDADTGVSYTYTKRIVDKLISHCKAYTVNKPFVGKYSMITKDEYISYFPDIDTTDWELRQLLYSSGGNAWIPDINGNLTRRSQRTLNRDSETSDLVQESNMRTLSQLVYLLQNKIDEYLLEYDDEGVLKTLSDEVNNMFSNWKGKMVDSLEITFQKDINVDGGDIIVCCCNVTFRGLILRVPIIVNVNRRDS